MNAAVAVLYNIRSIHNVGSIFRTADGAGISKIYLCGITPSPIDRFGKFRADFSKVSLGAERHVAWEKARSAAGIIKKLKEDGYKILAVEQHKNSVLYYKSKSLDTTFDKHKHNLALVFGAEVRGLPPPLLKIADEILEIPMFGKKESLNVSVAFGIVAYELSLKLKSQNGK